MSTVQATEDWADVVLEDATPDGRVGLLALATDANIEDNLRALLPASVGMYTTRLSHTNPITVETLRSTAGGITEAGREIMTGHDIDVLVYGCTAGAAAIGHEEIVRLLKEAKPTAHCVSPVSAASAALRHLGITRPSILTPNIPEINDVIAGYFSQAGFEVQGIAGLGIRDDLDITRVAPRSLLEAARHACAPESDGLLISCTSLRATAVIDQIEALIDRPVVTSNQALVWEITRELGVTLPGAGLGRLFAA
jgi:maleate isomerase